MDSRKGKMILIAEDDPFISRMYQTKLQSSGFEVVLANNGREAIDLIHARKPDLMMIDLDMPEMTGFQALESLSRSGFDLASSQVMILTNSSKAEDRDKAKEYGAEYLVKSDITPREVLDLIDVKLGINQSA